MSQAFSQDTIGMYYGVYGGYGLNIHNANFKKIIDTCPSCNPMDYGTQVGSGFNVGLLFEYPLKLRNISRPLWAVGLRAGITDWSATFINEEEVGNVLNSNGVPVTGTADHILENTLMLLSFTPYTSYHFTDALSGNVGINIGYIYQGKYNYREKLQTPSNATYKDNGTQVRNARNDEDITTLTRLQFGIALGLGYDLPIGKYSILSPEIQATVPLTRVDGNPWSVATIRGGVSIKLPILKREKEEVLEPQRFEDSDTTIEHGFGLKEEIVLRDSSKVLKGLDTFVTYHYVKYVLDNANMTASIEFYAYKGVHKVLHPEIVVEEFEMTESFPLLPIVYFKDGESNLSLTAQKLLSRSEYSTFQEGNLPSDVFQCYYNTLNVIAKRMQKEPTAKISLYGTSTGRNKDAENKDIARQRAESVKRYLVDVCGIANNRISVGTRPAELRDTTSSSFSDVVEENQKVEIASDSLNILMPITLSDLKKEVNPPTIYLKIDANSDTKTSKYNLFAVQSGDTLFKQSEAVDEKNLSKEIEWNIEKKIPVLEHPIQTYFKVTDEFGAERSKIATIQISQRTVKKKRANVENDSTIEKHSLVLFDRNSANLTKLHTKILSEIRNDISTNASVNVTGYVDRTGNDERNKVLAKDRGSAVAAFVNPTKKLHINEKDGQSIKLYDNDLPYGRAFSRTVIIEIHTPVK